MCNFVLYFSSLLSMCFHTFIIEKNKVFNLFSEKKEHVLLLFNRTYWSAASVWYPPPLHSFISLSIFTLNWHLCDRHLPLPGDCLIGWKSPASLLPLSAPLLASLMPTGVLHLVSQAGRSARRHLRPGSWPERPKLGMADTRLLGSHFPRREGRQSPASKWDCPNKQTKKQMPNTHTSERNHTHSERHKAKTQECRCLGLSPATGLVSQRADGEDGWFWDSCGLNPHPHHQDVPGKKWSRYRPLIYFLIK